MIRDNDKTTDLVENIETDAAASAAAAEAALIPKTSILGRPFVVVASLLMLVASVAWNYKSLREPFPPQVISSEQQLQAARNNLVYALTIIEGYRAKNGEFPENVGKTGLALAADLGYRKTNSGVVIGTYVDNKLVWLNSTDDTAAFLNDGSHVPRTNAFPSASGS